MQQSWGAPSKGMRTSHSLHGVLGMNEDECECAGVSGMKMLRSAASGLSVLSAGLLGFILLVVSAVELSAGLSANVLLSRGFVPSVGLVAFSDTGGGHMHQYELRA